MLDPPVAGAIVNVVPVMVTTTSTEVLVRVSVTAMVAGLSAASTLTPPAAGHLFTAGPALATGAAIVADATIIKVVSRNRPNTSPP